MSTDTDAIEPAVADAVAAPLDLLLADAAFGALRPPRADRGPNGHGADRGGVPHRRKEPRVTSDANVSNPQGAVLASALLNRLPALTDELLKRVLKQSDIDGDDRPVPIDDLHQSLQDNLTFMFSNLGRPGSHDLAAPRRTGRRRAE